MLQISGQVINVLETPGGKRQDGTTYEGGFVVQLMCQNDQTNGESKMELVNLRVVDAGPFKPFVGKNVVIPVGAFARNSAINFYIPKNTPREKLVRPGS